jgi:hypothetical protein
MTATQLPALVEWAKALAPTFVSALAVFVSVATFRLSRQIAHQQTKLAARQADIALDRLRYDCFEKRYRIYDATKSLIETVLNNSRKPDFRTSDIKQYIIIIDEAPFFFPPPICNIFTEIKKKTDGLIDADRKRAESDEIRKKSVALADELDDTLMNLPKLFEPVLSFPQLTKSV